MRNAVLIHLLFLMVLLTSACRSTKPVVLQADTLSSAMHKHAISHNMQNKPFAELALKQAWLEEHEPDFMPALTRIYENTEGLVVLAVIRDRSIYNSADRLNQKTWTTGDVFEIFFEVSEELYYEFHVTPENQNLLLRWDPAHFKKVRRGEAKFESALIDDPSFIQSKATINTDDNYWTVYALIPYQALDSNAVATNPNWRFSFARYDMTVGEDHPVLSATPDYPEANFHDRERWHPLSLVPFSQR